MSVSEAPADTAGGDGSSGTIGRLLGDRVFAPFFYANALSNTGNWFQNVAAGIVVYDLTGSNTAVGAVSMLQFIATMLLTPYMGRVSDRVNRQRMLLVGQAIAFSGAAALAVVAVVVGVEDLPGPWPIYVATAVIGLGASVILPSLQAFVPALVGDRDLDQAIALNSMTFNIARSVGPVSAGIVVAVLGAEWAFGINALTFVPLLLVLVFLRPRGDVSAEPGADGSVADGVRWIADRPAVTAVLAATLAVGWTSDPFSTLMPALADELGGGEATVGILVGSFGAGAAVSAPFTSVAKRVIGRRRVIPWGLVSMAAGLALTAVSPSTVPACVGAALTGSGFLFGVTGTNTELQRALPEAFRGRIMGWWSVAFLGCRPLAAAVDGVVADQTDVRVAIAVAAAVALVSAVLFARLASLPSDTAP